MALQVVVGLAYIMIESLKGTAFGITEAATPPAIIFSKAGAAHSIESARPRKLRLFMGFLR